MSVALKTLTALCSASGRDRARARAHARLFPSAANDARDDVEHFLSHGLSHAQRGEHVGCGERGLCASSSLPHKSPG